MIKRLRKLSPFQVIMLGFLGVILVGALLLMLPFASKEKGSADFLDCLFTSVSTVCVTGLVTQDTATYWTLFGQIVILLLIQTGGLGVVTVAAFIGSLSGRKIGFTERTNVQSSISALEVGGIVRLTRFAVKVTAMVELSGFVLLCPIFIQRFGPAKGIWYSLFHSVSAFCNAGFDLMGEEEKFSSLASFSDNVWVNIVIMLLIIIGGIGFLTWDDIKTHRHHLKKYRMQSKVILATSAALIVFPSIWYFFEMQGSIGERILTAVFQSVTSRTAGFTTVDLNILSGGGTGLYIMLMLIGGSPGSTAGGMKTTTAAVLFASSFSVFGRRKETTMFKRSIADDIVRSASAILLMYISLCLVGAIAVSKIEGLPLKPCIFETASAVGTVGLTLGITPQLGTVSHCILMLLMYIGRIGGLNVIYAAVSQKGGFESRYPKEKITVG